MKKTGDNNRQYIEYIVNNKVHDISELARRMDVSQDRVIEDVNEMLARGMLGRARLNLNNGRIEFPKPTGQRPQASSTQRPPSPHRDVRSNGQRQSRPIPREVEPQYEQFQPKTIRCTSCSANNFVESLPATCDYCGTSLHESK